MPRPSTTRPPTRTERQRLATLLEAESPPLVQRRAHVLLLHAAGLCAQDIAHALLVHPNTVYADLRVFRRQGLAAIERPTPRGAPLRLAPALVQQVRQVAEVPPSELGLPYGRWSLATLRDYLIAHRMLRRISREHLRQLLKRGAFACGRCSAS